VQNPSIKTIKKNKNFSQFRNIVFSALNRDDPQSVHFKAASYNPALPLEVINFDGFY
jgi:hypothetical protein